MDADKQKSVDRFSGVNNVDDPTRLFPRIEDYHNIFPLQEANNVYIDNTYRVLSRPGYTKVFSGTDIHSLWSNNNVCFVVDGDTLYSIDNVYQKIAVRTGLMLSARMSYAEINNRTYYTNGYQIGYVYNGVNYSLPTPDIPFKETLPAGQLIETHLGSIYVAVGNTLYVSDPLCDYYDTRYGYRIFKDTISLLREVDENGLYVVDSETWFLKGKINEDFEKSLVYPHRAISFTDVVIAGNYMADNTTGDYVMWTAENGIVLGDNSGKVVNLTQDRYSFTVYGKGTAFVKDMDNMRYYINSIY